MIKSPIIWLSSNILPQKQSDTKISCLTHFFIRRIIPVWVACGRRRVKNLRRLSPIICSSIILNYLNYLQCPFILLFFNSKVNRGLAQSLLSTSELIIIVIVMVRTTFDSGMFSTASLPRLIQHSRLRPRVHEVVPALIYHRYFNQF